MNTKFVKQRDKKGIYIIEGIENKENVFSITRIICLIQQQESEIEEEKLADVIVDLLNKKQKLINALMSIATGEIVGEELNLKDSLAIIRNIASEALNEVEFNVKP